MMTGARLNQMLRILVSIGNQKISKTNEQAMESNSMKTALTTILGAALFWAVSLPSTAAELVFIHNDHLGTPQAITDQTQAVVWQGRYKPFGEVAETMATVGNTARFPGQYLDEESGLHYNYFRDYDPSTGRYMQSDPLGLLGGLNTYGYALLNPISYTDPLGLITWAGTGSTIGVIEGGGAVRFRYELVSECIDGQRVKVVIIAGGPAVGVGVTASGSKGSVSFEDGNSVPRPDIFRGPSKFLSASYAFAGIGYGISAIELGGARSIGGGPLEGWDASIFGGAGISTVTDISYEDCSCE